MHSKFKEKVAICYSCSGESYRESALKNLQDYYFDDENLHYFIITDDKSYFDGVQRKNLVVNELKDFYEEFPLVEKYEALIDAKDKSEYAQKFVDTNYQYSFSLMRFHLLQAYRSEIKNVCMMCTDTKIDFNIFVVLPFPLVPAMTIGLLIFFSGLPNFCNNFFDLSKDKSIFLGCSF